MNVTCYFNHTLIITKKPSHLGRRHRHTSLFISSWLIVLFTGFENLNKKDRVAQNMILIKQPVKSLIKWLTFDRYLNSVTQIVTVGQVAFKTNGQLLAEVKPKF